MWRSRWVWPALITMALMMVAFCGSGVMQMHVEAEKEAQPTLQQMTRYEPHSPSLGISGPREETVRTPDLIPLIEEEQELSEKCTAWLRVPGTKIDYPIVYDPEIPNNNYYTDHNAFGDPDPNGTFFADRRALFGEGTREDLALVTTLYGHSFSDDPDGELMSSLKRYRDEDFARENPYIYFSTWKENMVFEVIAVFDAHVDLPYIRYDLQAMEFKEMLEGVFESSLYDYGADIGFDDKLLVISCCTMSVEGHPELDPLTTEYRFAVMGRLVPEGERLKTEADFTVNPSPAPPDDYKDPPA